MFETYLRAVDRFMSSMRFGMSSTPTRTDPVCTSIYTPKQKKDRKKKNNAVRQSRRMNRR